MLDVPIAGVRAIPPVKEVSTNERYKSADSYQTTLLVRNRAAEEYCRKNRSLNLFYFG